MNVKIAPSEVYDNLKEQMKRLKTSILNSYSGQYHEAKRIAGNIRFMAHDNPDRSLIAKSRESFDLEEEIIFIDFEDISQRKIFLKRQHCFHLLRQCHYLTQGQIRRSFSIAFLN